MFQRLIQLTQGVLGALQALQHAVDGLVQYVDFTAVGLGAGRGLGIGLQRLFVGNGLKALGERLNGACYGAGD